MCTYYEVSSISTHDNQTVVNTSVIIILIFFIYFFSLHYTCSLQLCNNLQDTCNHLQDTCIPPFSTCLLLPYSFLSFSSFIFFSPPTPLGGQPQFQISCFFSYLLFWLPFTHGGTWRTIHCRLCINCYGTGYIESVVGKMTTFDL
jgi:hypothetical protein